jgi:16S rRNA (guanine966-N2)-methyltransferase
LTVPATGTRPTADRVREALFSSLQASLDLTGLRVLDLYAGSGALGLEALSRGAASVTLVDSSAAVFTALRRNIDVVGMPEARAVRSTVEAFLRGLPQETDLVLLDPPYDLPDGSLTDVLETLTAGWLTPGAVVVVERSARGGAVGWPRGFDGLWNRRFGDTSVSRAVWYGHEQRPG